MAAFFTTFSLLLLTYGLTLLSVGLGLLDPVIDVLKKVLDPIYDVLTKMFRSNKKEEPVENLQREIDIKNAYIEIDEYLRLK